jgi:MYXO-CTERM domain-containing protein
MRSCRPMRPTLAVAPFLALALTVAAPPAAAWRASLTADSFDGSGWQQVSLCQGTIADPPGVQYHGPWTCAAADGSGTQVEFGNSEVWARADLADGSLRLSATPHGSASLDLGDLLWISVPGLDPGEHATLRFELQVDGGFGRPPGSLTGHAGFLFQAYSGVFSFALTDTVGAQVAWRTASGSDAWNTTAAPEEFQVFNPTGDWTVVSTDHFRAEIDISGDDPTLGLRMGLSAAGPADFAHTATLRFGGAPVDFFSESGVLLSAVPEPGASALWALGLAALLVHRRRAPGQPVNPRRCRP